MNRVVAVGLVAVLPSVVLAGPINPPIGPVSPTYKTLVEVEPRIAVNATNTPGDSDSTFRISQPGSYYLAGNITGEVGKHGIKITAGGVTLDLNGFDLVGVTAMGAFDGVSVTAGPITNITVVNGSVRNWGDEGVDMGPGGATNCRVEGVLASGNGGHGILGSSDCMITNCAAYLNAGHGIAGGTGTIFNCTAYQNSGTGITIDSGTISNCTALSNTVSGIVAGIGCTITGCTLRFNSVQGIFTADGCTISDCTVYRSFGHGIVCSSGSTVVDCSLVNNLGDGILCTGRCIIRGNTCHLNGAAPADGAGIHALLSDNRIEGNHCSQADRGIDVDGHRNHIEGNSVNGNSVGFAIDGTQNILYGNTASTNFPNYFIVVGNSMGPIVSVSANVAAVNGSAAPGTLTTTDPHANFSH